MLISSWLDRSGTIEALTQGVELLSEKGAKSVLVLACINNLYRRDEMREFVRASKVPLFGALFPKLVMGEDLMDKGAILLGVSEELSVALYRDLSSRSIDVDRIAIIGENKLKPSQNLFTFVDGRSPNCNAFIFRLYEAIGSGVNIFGACTGGCDPMQTPSIICEEGLVSDAGLVVSLPYSLDYSIGHGLEVADDSFMATETRGNKIISIDYSPAAEVYLSILNRHLNQAVTPENFLDIANRFPVGIVDLHGDIMVREVIGEENGSLVCAGDIADHSMLHTLKSDTHTLISTAKTVAKRAIQPGRGASFNFIVSCAYRAKLMGAEFKDELVEIKRACGESTSVVGVLSLGQIANFKSGVFGLHNKSVMLGQMHYE